MTNKVSERLCSGHKKLSQPSYATIEDHLSYTDSNSFCLMGFMKFADYRTYRIRDPLDYIFLINFDSVSVIYENKNLNKLLQTL